jgi:hypothetical protein
MLCHFHATYYNTFDKSLMHKQLQHKQNKLYVSTQDRTEDLQRVRPT